jgi:hypothetical protein
MELGRAVNAGTDVLFAKSTKRENSSARKNLANNTFAANELGVMTSFARRTDGQNAGLFGLPGLERQQRLRR